MSEPGNIPRPPLARGSRAEDPESFGARPGEVAITLPETFDAGLHFIGRLRTPWIERRQCPKNGRESDAVCRVELDRLYRPGLADLAGTTHLWLLYWMDRAPRNLVVQTPRIHGTGRGTFALRSPARPNPIALSAVRVVGLDADGLSVVGLDCLDGTPLLDIKPYFTSTDSLPEAVVGWRQEQEERRKGAAPSERT
ncbi:tRNA (N6-threonylcarbamoyladenosine(37)-N6)-methyltransferase TrmO [Ancylobacter sp. 6x-1]|uniref:tRNA (N6-threonylcarbamoyladenosine(37)-N6)-methyltransferase TrmO n=1 Tax=Ancylobacter crimeensis TaxID=2579147 RepID=A0ABT0DA20_9HYPH|nr:tRNA (N6-threonylcarbamoyladenosine(37)-N6)-methyltransferase TrmO [Ancylobacter crimeensis]MCK0196803.1 tRNA (N6-threonylcarbamoyladenosine(37)-N6)-methyltransferase TrmO [Ancylobacter crimeensis]